MDTVLNRIPNISIIDAVVLNCRDLKRDVTPTKSPHVLAPGLKGPLYTAGDSIITGEELSWFLRRGYLRSELFGRTATVQVGGHSYEEFIQPKVRYSCTVKGFNTPKWV